MIKIEKLTNKELLDDLKWLIKATSKDANRHHLHNTIHVADNKASCTDGHRIHMLLLDCDADIPDGDYDIIVNTAQQVVLELNPNINYPPISQFTNNFSKLSEKDTFKSINIDGVEISPKRDRINQDISRLMYELSTQGGVCVNFEYLKEAVHNSSLTDMHVLAEKPAYNPIYISMITRIAVIMPIRIY